MCDLVHTWEKVQRRGAFSEFRYARTPASMPIGMGLDLGSFRPCAPMIRARLSLKAALAKLPEEVEIAKGLCPPPAPA
jgi:hypothetical protein